MHEIIMYKNFKKYNCVSMGKGEIIITPFHHDDRNNLAKQKSTGKNSRA
jgi:hypothetical protein